MSRKVKFKTNFSEYVLLTINEAAKIADLLDGKTVITETWIGDEAIAYAHNEGYTAPLEFTDGVTLYKPESEYLERKKAHEESLVNVQD